MESTDLSGRIARWQILLSEFDIVYVNQKAVKGNAIADFLASRALEDYESLNIDFPNEDLMYVATTKEDTPEGHPWKLNFDGASNYKACIMGIRASIECKIKVLEVYVDSALVIYQLKSEWEIRDPKLINYRELVLDLIKVFDDITFRYLLQDENQMADVLATLASMIRNNKYPDQATENDKRTLRRLASGYVLDREIL
ncbi:uncharacterized protein [Gossypium hirsutum]|uniref:RNase H type-1 domain-containing protein n=1 Tax=Gossypium hirsutum TaxID=3635 RepID=A0A1U8NG35_GOSHI|nr:uncharacterized protein LOC107948019 [Gossypium hirsutum]